MTKTLPISDVKTHLPALLDGVTEREDEIVVTRNGTPAAVILNYAEYERFKETLDVLSDPGLLRQIQRSRAFYAKGRRGSSFEDVFGEPLWPRVKRRR
jgi:antitoxin YefM